MSESIQAIPPFVDAPAPYVRRRRAARPTAREWVRHAALFLLTAITSTIAGVMLASPELKISLRPPLTLLDYVLYIPEFYLLMLGAYVHEALVNPTLLAQGGTFSGALLLILATHEAGHYIACRRYGVDATLPFFIPAPPLFLAGTFGAFIKIKSPIPSRRALFDIGVAGPLAGFIVAIPIAVVGVLTLQPAPPGVGGIFFNDPLLFRLIAGAGGINLAGASSNPLQMAAWLGMLVTSLNLLPVGQLDGGHATYAVFGPTLHKWFGRAAFALMATLSLLGWFWHGSPSGFLYTVLLAFMLRVRHPQAEDLTPLDRPRLLVAWLTLLVFILCFLPFPITIT